MDNNPFIQGTGAKQSHYDVRTISHETAMVGAPLITPLIKGGTIYDDIDIEHQHKVGICTGISLTQNAAKALGQKFSDDFQYLLQKKYFDLNWKEGSSIFNAMKVGKTYGFLPVELFTYVTEDDRNLPYWQYVAKLQAIPEMEIQRLIKLCVYKLGGYSQVDVSNSQSIAKAINDSKSGILCRYTAGSTWWTAKDGRLSWASDDIDPLREPTDQLSGHAIGATYFDYTVSLTQTLANTWGTDWNDKNKGTAHIDWSNYKMTEAWIPYYDFTPTVPPYTHNFTTDINYGDMNDEVTALQKALSVTGHFTVQPTGYYGEITRQAVLKFQIENTKLSLYERYILRGKRVGPKTRNALNLIFNH